MSAPTFPQNRPAGASWIHAAPSEPVRAWFVHPSRPHLGWLAGTVIADHGRTVDVAREGIPYPIRLDRDAVLISPLAVQQVVELLTAGGVAQIPGHPDLAVWPGDPAASVRVFEPGSGWALLRPGLTPHMWVPIVGTGFLGAAPAAGWVALRPDPDRYTARICGRRRRWLR